MKGKILIVEDEKKLTEVMRLYLEKEGYEVEIALDGSKGDEAINQVEYDLIILDVMMPEKDGWSLLRKITNKGKTNSLFKVEFTSEKKTTYYKIKSFQVSFDNQIIYEKSKFIKLKN